MKLRHIAIAAFMLLLLLGATIGRPQQPHFSWERIPAFWALFGFAGAALMILALRRLGETLLQRDEEYYEERSTEAGTSSDDAGTAGPTAGGGE